MSHSNPYLVAKQIIDKNGKPTTVYVFPGTADKGCDRKTYSWDDRITFIAEGNPPSYDRGINGYYFSVEVVRHEQNVKLPRKQKLRDVRYLDYVMVDAPIVYEEEAPVGMRVGDKEYRLYDGVLYEQLRGENADNPDELFRDLVVQDQGTNIEDAYKAYADMFIVLDGHVWRRSGEPRYIIQQEGFIWGDTLRVVFTDSSFEDTAPNDKVFSANERDLAIETARKISEKLALKGVHAFGSETTDYPYTAFIESIDNLPVIEVLDSNAVGSNHEFATRVDYPELELDFWSSAKESDNEQKLREVIPAYRKALESIPGAVEDIGGGLKRVDWSKVPDGLKRNYQEATEYAQLHGILI